ncbi:MAG: hypothetical protein H7641_08835 [Candidatus Heimdallarchaeota archaeon]|nr:hypothetical protein [Candidatus Heimdallarchaeota archaeon]MCK4877671.1 hypothetical protein [Candidatus Heimdallarchaeota archaeon]
MKKNRKFMLFFLLTCILTVSAYNSSNNLATGSTIANLVLKTNGAATRPDFGLYIAQYLREIGINVKVTVEEWAIFVGELIATHNYDLGIVGWGGSITPDMRINFMEKGTMNIFDIRTDIPYCNQSEQMLKVGITIMDFEQRQHHYFKWQELLMDKILPMLPLFTFKRYQAIWSNTKGYDMRWGFVNCAPYMSFDGYHHGQKNISEFNAASGFWLELKPLFIVDSDSAEILELIDEAIVVWSPDQYPLKTGLVHDWEEIDDHHYKFYLRDNIFWNPSVNITERERLTPLHLAQFSLLI